MSNIFWIFIAKYDRLLALMRDFSRKRLYIFGLVLVLLATSVYAQKKVRIGFFEDSVFHRGQTDSERKSGYGYEYYQELAKYTDWNYEYVYGTWNEIYLKFLKGEVDIIDAVSRTPDREKKMLFSQERMGVDDFYIFALDDNSEISEYDLSTLNGKKIGVNKNSVSQTYLEDYIKEKKLDCTVVPCENYGHRISLLLSREIDAMVTTDAISSQGIRAINKIASQDYFFAVSKDRPDLLAEINMAQSKILRRNPLFESRLRRRYYFNAVANNHLTDEEMNWLKNHRVLKLGYRINVMPFCSQNSETGELTGMLADVLQLMSQNLGITFETIPYSNNNLLSAGLNNGDVDLIFPVVDDVWYSEKQGYIQTSPLNENRMSLVFSGDYKGETEYLKIGYVLGSPAQEMFMESMGLFEKAIPFDDMDSLFKAILKGKVDCTIMISDVANYQIRRNDAYSFLKIANMDDFVSYSFGVDRKNIELYSLVELGLSLISKGVINESVNRYSNISEEYAFKYLQKRYRVPVMATIILILLIFVIVILAYNVSLKKEKKKVVEAHEKAVKANADARTDELTGVGNRRAFYEVLEDNNIAEKYMVVGFLDVDDFKAFNTKYGHDTGDQVLRFFVKCLRAAFPNEFLCRFGGDEFVFISEKPLEEVKVRCEYFNQLITDGLIIRETGEKVEIGSSIGLTESKRRAADIRDILNQADIAMYRAKNKGKNRIVVG